MKQAQNARKQRTRNVSRKGGGKNNNPNGNPGNHRNDNKVRGNPKQLLEKYKNQARDAMQAGDRVSAEYYYQFADHYQRVLNEMQSYQDDDEQKQRRGRGRGRRGDDNQDAQSEQQTSGETANDAKGPEAAQGGDQQKLTDPASTEQPVEVHPELDLGSENVAAAAKPKRKPPVRRKRVTKKVDAETPTDDVVSETSQDGEAA